MGPLQRSILAVKKWLRHTWLSRLPVIGRLFGDRTRPAVPPKPRPRLPLEVELLERLCTPNDMLAVAQSAIIGGEILAVVGTFPKPVDVILSPRGWATGRTAESPADTTPASHLPEQSPDADPVRLQPFLSNTYFANLEVVPRDGNGSVTQSAEEQAEPEEPKQPEPITDEGMQDPLSADFLKQLDGLLDDPLGDGDGDEGDEGGAIGSGEDAGSGDGSAGWMPSGGSGGSSSASVGGGGSTSGLAGSSGGAPSVGTLGGGSGDEFDPFLNGSFGGGSGLGSMAGGGGGRVAGDGGGVGGQADGGSGGSGQSLLGESGGGGGGAAARESVVPPTAQPEFGKLPLAFEANLGQTDSSEVQFLARGRGYNVYLTADQAVLALGKVRTEQHEGDASRRVQDVVRLRFVGADPTAPLVARDGLPGRSNYFRGGDSPLSLIDVPQYSRVSANIYDGVSVVYQGDQGRLRFDLHVEAGRDASVIELAYDGAQSVTIDEQGRLVLSTPSGDVIQQAPVIYQLRGGARESLTGRYVSRGVNRIGFEVTGRDPNAELVIDPSLIFSSYLGGNGNDFANGVAVDLAGNAYLTGQTLSTNFPGASGTLTGSTDAFVLKMNANGSGLMYSTYLGGSGTADEAGRGIAVDPGGYAYVTGSTASSSFPTTFAYQSSSGGGVDAFLTKLAPAGNALVYSSYLGGSSDDEGLAVAVDPSGRAHLTGVTQSGNFPTTLAYDSSHNGGKDAFVASFTPDGGIVGSTYLGGASDDTGYGIAYSDGLLLVTGQTASSGFPSVGVVSSLSGTTDAFAAKVAVGGASVAWSRFLGGTSGEAGRAVAAGPGGQSYLTGETSSSNFNTAGGPYQSTNQGGTDGYFTVLDATGAVTYSTYFGGSGDDAGYTVAADRDGNALLAGQTKSTNFPNTNAVYGTQGDSGAYNDAFAARFSLTRSLDWSTYLPGNNDDYARGVAVDYSGDVYVTGATASTNFPTQTPYQGSKGTGYDGFITKLAGLPAPLFTAVSTDSGSSSTDELTNDTTLTLSLTSSAGATVKVYQAGAGYLGDATHTGSGNFTYATGTLTEGTHAFTATATVGGATSEHSVPFLVTVDGTAPAVTLEVASSTYDLTPEVRVTATDLNGLPDGTTVTLDIDLDNDGVFGEGGEPSQNSTLAGGIAVFSVASALSISTVRMRARVTDRAGNEGTSSTKTVVVSATSSVTLTDVTARVDPRTGDALLQRGNLTVWHALDLDLSPGTGVGLSPALVYHSERVDARPIVQAVLQTDNTQALPEIGITVHLNWNGADYYTTIAPDGITQGEALVIGVQPEDAVTTTGRYTYTLEVYLDYPTPVTRYVSNYTFAVADDLSPFGAGWSLAPVDRLVDVAATTVYDWGASATVTYSAGKLRVYPTGGYDFFEYTGSAYTSPAGNAGTLAVDGSGFKYTAAEGWEWNYNSAGELTSIVNPDGTHRVTFTYSSGKVSTIATPDTAVSTITYSSGLATKIETAPRTVTFTHTGTDLTTVQNPDGGLRTFGYAAHKLTTDTFANLTGAYTYTYGVLSGRTMGDGGAEDFDPVALLGMTAVPGTAGYALLGSGSANPVRLPVQGADGLTRRSYGMVDRYGRLMELTAPAAGTTRWDRDSGGYVTKQTDALGRVTTVTVDSAGYTTGVVLPDGRTQSWAYGTNKGLTQYVDQRGSTWTYDIDSYGRRTGETNPLGEKTTFTYANGLLETVKNARGYTTSYGYDSKRRLEFQKNAAGDLATWTYDSNGNVATYKNERGYVTTFVNDALGRVLSVTDPENGLATNLYNGAGLLTSATDAKGRVSNYSYNSRGLNTSVVQAAGTAQQRSLLSDYDAASQLTGTRDANANWSYSGYDDAGRPKTSTDALGNLRQSFWNLAGEVTRAQDELGNPMLYDRDAVGRVTKTTDALNNVGTTVYDEAGNVTGSIDALGNRTSFVYDRLNRQTSVTEAVGTSIARTSTTAYDAVGNVFQRIDALGRVTEYEYDSLNRLTKITEAKTTADERVMTYAYDKVGNQVGSTDWRGFRTESTFDKNNRRTVFKEAVGQGGTVERTTTTVYDALGNVTSVVDALGRTVSYVLDALDRVVSTTEAVGTGVARTMSALLDSVGNAYGQIDGLGKVWTTGHDALNRPHLSVDPLGNSGGTERDAAGNTIRQTDARGKETTFQHDALNRVTKSTDALGNFATAIYDEVGNRTEGIDALGNRTTFVYDELNRHIATVDALGRRTTTVYDAVDNVLQTIDALGEAMVYTYDSLNRQVTRQDPGLGVFTTVYDDAGNAVNEIAPEGARKTTHVYDALNRRTQTIDARGGTITYEFDKLGNMTGLVDPVSNRTTFVYDSRNRQVNEIDPLGKTLTYAYDAADRKTSQTDRLGRVREFSYDDAGRLTREVWKTSGGTPVNTLTYSHDENGNQLTAGDADGTYTMTFDDLNRRATAAGLFGVSFTFTYDAVGNRTKVQDSFGGVTTSTYNAVHLLTRREFNGGTGSAPLRFDHAYTARDQLEGVTRYSDLAGSTKVGETSYAYDDAGRTTNIHHKNGSSSSLLNLTYTYDLASRVTSETANVSPTSYGYDDTDQLTSAGTYAYSYDLNGNRTTSGYQTGAGNRISNDGVYTYTYDFEGNLTKRSKAASDETWTFEYDHRNQVVGVEKRATDGGTLQVKTTYVYDVFNNRVQDQTWTSGSGSVTTRSVFADTGTVFADLDGSSSLTTRYVRMEDGEYTVIAARVSSGTVAWPLLDKQGSTKNVVNGSGTLIATITLDAYGNVTGESSPVNTGRFPYTGLAYQPLLQMHFAQNRALAPAWGGMLQEDPERFGPGETHLHRYVGNSPTNRTDPSGLFWWVGWDPQDTWYKEFIDEDRRRWERLQKMGFEIVTHKDGRSRPDFFTDDNITVEVKEPLVKRVGSDNGYDNQWAVDGKKVWIDADKDSMAAYYLRSAMTRIEEVKGLAKDITSEPPPGLTAGQMIRSVDSGADNEFRTGVKQIKPLVITGVVWTASGPVFVQSPITAGTIAQQSNTQLMTSMLATTNAARTGVITGVVVNSMAKKRPKQGATGKAGATDKPSWVKDSPNVGESGNDFARRMMDQKYGAGKWSGTGPGSEYSKIKKWADRHFE